MERESPFPNVAKGLLTFQRRQQLGLDLTEKGRIWSGWGGGGRKSDGATGRVLEGRVGGASAGKGGGGAPRMAIAALLGGRGHGTTGSSYSFIERVFEHERGRVSGRDPGGEGPPRGRVSGGDPGEEVLQGGGCRRSHPQIGPQC